MAGSVHVKCEWKAQGTGNQCMGTIRGEGQGQWSGLCACEGHTIVLQWFKLKQKKEKEKKKTQLGLVEQVSSWAAVAGVGDEQPGWHVHKEMPSWPVVLVLCAEKEVYVCQKNRKGSGREGSGTGSGGSERV